MEQITTYKNFIIVELHDVTQVYEVLHLPKYIINLPLKSVARNKKQEVFQRKLEKKKEFPNATVNNMYINVNATHVDKLIIEKSITSVGNLIQHYATLDYTAHILKPKKSITKQLKLSVLLMKQHLLPANITLDHVIKYIKTLPNRRLALPKLRQSLFYLDEIELQKKTPVRHILRIHLNKYYLANKALFIDGSIVYFDKLLNFLTDAIHYDNVQSEIAVSTLIDQQNMPYIFSSKNTKYGLITGKTLIVSSTKYAFQQWIPHVLHQYRKRVLWIGERPTHQSISNVHTIPLVERKLDLPSMSREASKMQDITIIGKLIEQITQIPMFREEFRYNILRSADSNLYSKINREPLSDVIQKVTDKVGNKSTENQNSRQLELAFTQFLTIDKLKFLDHPRVDSEYIHTDFDFRVQHIEHTDTELLAIQALTLITWAMQKNVPYDLVIINDEELTYSLLRKRFNSDILFTLFQNIHTKTSYILYTARTLQTSDPILYLEGRRGMGHPTYYDYVNPALRVRINNKVKNIGFYKADNSANAQLRPQEDKNTEQQWFTSASNFVQHIFTKFFLQQGTDIRIITSDKMLELITEGIKRWELLEELQQGERDNSPDSQFSETEYRETRRWLKRNELINVVRTGLTGLTDKFSLTEKGTYYHLTIINQARSLFDDFYLDFHSLEKELLNINTKILEIIQDDREYIAFLFNLIYINVMFIIYRMYHYTKRIPAKILGFVESWEETYRIADADAFLQQLQVEGYDAHIQRVEDTTIEQIKNAGVDYEPQRVFYSIKQFISLASDSKHTE